MDYIIDTDSFIISILNKYGIDYQHNASNVIDNSSLNFYMPKYNLAIEACDLYKYRNSIIKNSKHHVQKLEACLQKNIQLLTIFGDHIIHNPLIVEERIKCKLHLIPRMFHPRQLEISSSYNKKEINQFINENHLQGAKGASVNIVATYGGFICAAMTFGPLRRSLGQKVVQENVYEMYRFVSMGNIPGIASKLFQYFVKNHNPRSVISYADRCWGEGGLYTTLGFTKEVSNGPNYWYTKDFKSKVHRFGFTKHSLVQKGYDKNLTELEIMTDLGYDRIYDCGSNKFVLNNLNYIE